MALELAFTDGRNGVQLGTAYARVAKVQLTSQPPEVRVFVDLYANQQAFIDGKAPYEPQREVVLGRAVFVRLFRDALLQTVYAALKERAEYAGARDV